MKTSELKKTEGCYWLTGISAYSRCNSRVDKGPYCLMHNFLFVKLEEIRKDYEERKATGALRFVDKGGLRRLIRHMLRR